MKTIIRVLKIKQVYPDVNFIGVADGAKENWLHELKHKRGAASRLLKELELASLPKMTTAFVEKRFKAVTYLKNNKTLMRYSQAVKNHWPIGSGVTEAACKTLVKQRCCNSGMRWKNDSASSVLRIKALTQTHGRWEQLWEKLMGRPVNISSA